jgi:hypothetical protein
MRYLVEQTGLNFYKVAYSGYNIRSLDSTFGIGLAVGWVDEGFDPYWSKNFFFSMSFRPVLRLTQPPDRWVPGALSLGVKQPRRGADHSPRTCAEVKKMWICKSTHHTHSWCSA